MNNPVDENRPEDPNIREAREHARAASAEFRKTLEAWLPTGVIEHQRAARREFLMAVRSMVNAAIDRMEKEDTTTPPKS